MKNILFAISILICAYPSIIRSQSTYQKIENKNFIYFHRDTANIDSTKNLLVRDQNGLIVLPQTWEQLDDNITYRDTMFYDTKYLPIVVDGKILPSNLDFRSKDTVNVPIKYHLISPDSTFTPLITQREKTKLLQKMYFSNTENMINIKYSNLMLDKLPTLERPQVSKKNFFEELTSPDDPTFSTPEVAKFVPKIQYWVRQGEHSLQVAQNHISKNWHQGGNSSFLIRNYHKITLDYKKDKINFSNTLEWKLAMQSSPGDTLHNVNINDDLLRLYSVFGYKAFNKWSYSTTLEAKTPLFNTYPQNSNSLTAALFSPLDINIGIGMSYSLEKKFTSILTKNLKFSVNLAPFSMNFKHIRSKDVDETKFGLESGKYTKIDYGSLVNSNLEFNFNSFISWNSRFKYFTNYERAEMEFENKLNMSLNRFLSTTIGLYVRFDDDSPKMRDDKWNYFQVNELLSFGLNYKW